MKQHEKDAQLAALRKQLAELEALPVEPEQPLCVMPGRMEKGGSYWVVDLSLFEASPSRDERYGYDEAMFDNGFYFASELQASADAHAVSVMRLMRRQPGVVGADAPGFKFLPYVQDGCVTVMRFGVGSTDSACMFPCFSTEAQARAAIEAVGGHDALRRCAEYWSGVMK